MLRKLKNIYHFLIALIAAIRYGFPGRGMTVIGVTGTDGKTSTTHLIYHILKTSGKPVSMVSTIQAIINGKEYDTGFHVTTPSPFQLERLMREALLGGSKFFVLEVTSHGLDQNRVFGTSVDIGLVTNLSHEHIDYHKSIERYREAKAKLLRNVKYSILNRDNEHYDFFKSKSSGRVITFGLHKTATVNPGNCLLHPQMPGTYNLMNCLAAASVAKILSIPDKDISEAVASFAGIPGRLERVKSQKPYKIIIDFAHKPNALKEVLVTVRGITKNKIIVVFGAAGLRDILKRPMMGKIAAQLADYTILTAEDPRTEDVRTIISEIAEGCKEAKATEILKNRSAKQAFSVKGNAFIRIPDRQEAINFAIRRLARSGDTVLICGKGHEKSMCYGTVEYPWDEKKAIEKALYGVRKTAS